MSCRASVDNKTYNSGIHIIPEPREIEAGQGAFKIDGATEICTDNGNWDAEADLLTEKIGRAGGYTLAVTDSPADNCISLRQDLSLGDEEYRIEVSERQVALSASTHRGMF